MRITALLAILLLAQARAVEVQDQGLPPGLGGVTLHQPAAQWQRLRASRFWADLGQAGLDEALRTHADYQKARQGLAQLGAFLGQDPLVLLGELAGSELLLAGPGGDVGGKQGLLRIRHPDPGAMAAQWQRLRNLVQNKLGFWPVQPAGQLAGAELHQLGDSLLALRGDSLLLSKDRMVLEAALLALPAHAPAAAPGRLASAGFAPDAALRQRIPERSDNPIGSILAGHWLAVLRQANWIDASLSTDGDRLRLELAAQLAEPLGESYAGFSPSARPSALAMRLREQRRLAVVETHRDWAAWWRHADALLDDAGRAELVKLQQFLSLVFAGQDLVGEVLPGLGPELIWVAETQTFAEQGRAPLPSLPGFAIVVACQDEEQVGRRLRAGLQSLAGLFTVNQAQKGMATSMLAEVERVGQDRLHVVRRDEDLPAAPGLEWNFTPCVGTAAGHAVVASSAELGRLLLTELRALPAADAATPALPQPDRWRLDGPAAAALLAANREVLIADRMLKEGISAEQAGKNMDALLQALALLGEVHATGLLGPEGCQIELVADLRGLGTAAGSTP